MKLGVMQPYFFPYLGYFDLIARTDRWIVFDVVQYNSKSWMNRNRILHPRHGWQYITLPITRVTHGTAICDVRVHDRGLALSRVLGKLDHYRRRAPHYTRVKGIVEAAFSIDSDRLVDLNVSGLASVCDYLGLAFDYSLCSEVGFDLSAVSHAGQWALHIAKQSGASEYVNPPGGRALFVQSEWDEAAIRLTISAPPRLAYECGPYGFVEDLSILDVLMWNDAATVARALGKAG